MFPMIPIFFCIFQVNLKFLRNWSVTTTNPTLFDAKKRHFRRIASKIKVHQFAQGIILPFCCLFWMWFCLKCVYFCLKMSYFCLKISYFCLKFSYFHLKFGYFGSKLDYFLSANFCLKVSFFAWKLAIFAWNLAFLFDI